MFPFSETSWPYPVNSISKNASYILSRILAIYGAKVSPNPCQYIMARSYFLFISSALAMQGE